MDSDPILLLHAPSCPACNAPAVASRSVVTTLTVVRRFADAEGRQHTHDFNEHVFGHVCRNGHTWKTEGYAPCWCGWTNDPEARR